jgi:hypothetical protein
MAVHSIRRGFTIPLLDADDVFESVTIRDEPQVVELRKQYNMVKLTKVKMTVMQVKKMVLATGGLSAVGYIRFGVLPNHACTITDDAEKEKLTHVTDFLPGFEEIGRQTVTYHSEGDFDLSLVEDDLSCLPLRDATPRVFYAPTHFAGSLPGIARCQVEIFLDCSGPR